MSGWFLTPAEVSIFVSFVALVGSIATSWWSIHNANKGRIRDQEREDERRKIDIKNMRDIRNHDLERENNGRQRQAVAEFISVIFNESDRVRTGYITHCKGLADDYVSFANASKGMISAEATQEMHVSVFNRQIDLLVATFVANLTIFGHKTTLEISDETVLSKIEKVWDSISENISNFKLPEGENRLVPMPVILDETSKDLLIELTRTARSQFGVELDNPDTK